MQAFTAIGWSVPQAFLDVLNAIAWPKIPDDVVAKFGADLQSYMGGLGLPIEQAPPKPSSAPKLRVMRDIPQVIMKSFNAVNWTRVPAGDVSSLVSKLKFFITLKGIPTRKV